MKDWPSVALGDIFEIARGGSPRPIQNFLTEEPDGVNWVMIGDASDSSKYITHTKKRILKTGVKNSRMVYPGDFLLTNSMSFGHPYIMKTSGCIHDGWLVLSNKKGVIDQDYFYHLLGSDLIYAEFSRLASGSTVKNLNIEIVKGIKVSLPPLEEQRRIAAILDKADGVRRKRKEGIRLTEELLKSTFLEMFGDPVTNPKGWEIGKVIDYADCIVPGRDKPKSFTGDIPWVTTTDLNHLGYTYKSRLNIGLTIDEIKQVNARIIPKDSVLLTCAGDLGVTSIAGCNMVVNQQLHSFQCNEIDNHFLMHVITYQKNFMHQRATQTTVSYMNKTACNSIPVIYPPLELQRKFGGFCRKFSASTSQFDSLEQSENLFNSLLQRAFRGEL
jgi:type I restriction enzyme S subunit